MMYGAIAAGDSQTAAAGAAMFRYGGNAVDAAVAAAFASFVAEPSIVSIGGGGIATLVDGTGHPIMYDFFSDMPSGRLADNADFRQVIVDFGTTQQPFHIGRASAAVPGVVAGLCRIAEEHATLPLATLLEPAIRYAREGITLSPQMAYAYTLLRPILSDTPGLAALFFPDGRTLAAGDPLRFPQLANTLEQLGQRGVDLFYQGEVAQAIVADQAQHGGLITAQDLAGYRVHSSPPIQLEYRGYTILLPPPSSVGGVLIAFALKLLSSIEIARWGHNDSTHLRILAEVMRLTNIARAEWESSTGAIGTRLASFLGEEYLARFRAELHAILHGAKPPTEPQLSGGPNDTTHLSTADGEGRMVSITTSAGEFAGFVVGETGIVLNNMLGELDLHPQGFHQLPPATRLSTMMTPIVVLRDGVPVLAAGSGGSSRIRSAITQVVSNIIDFAMSPADAVRAPRVHFEAGVLQSEGGVSAQVVAELQHIGYRTNHWPGDNLFFGGAHIVARQDGRLIPVGDHRRGGAVVTVDS